MRIGERRYHPRFARSSGPWNAAGPQRISGAADAASHLLRRSLWSMAAPPSAALSASQLAQLAEIGEERTAEVGDVLYRVGDRTYPFVAILEGEVAIIDA